MSPRAGFSPLDASRWRRNPLLYQVNAVPWAQRFATPGGADGLAQISDGELDRLASLGFDLVWVMGVWTKGPLGVRIAREHPDAARWYGAALSDLRPDDVVGSPFAVAGYRVSPSLGGEAALHDLRTRLAARGIGLVLDFVPNHTARDHPWVRAHPDRYVSGEPGLAEADPDRYFRAETDQGPRGIAYGKDPNFHGWTDTAQLDWTRAAVHAAMAGELARIATLCDGVRCDMAMLVLPDVFERTWPEVRRDAEVPAFWPPAIAAARAVHPHFLSIAEVYWGLEPRLLELGFDYVYDKALFDRLRASDVPAVRQALEAPGVVENRAVHFIANHDEDPPAVAFGEREHAAAAVAALLPGMRLIHEGQLDGRAVRLPVQLGRNATAGLMAERLRTYGALLAAAREPEPRDGTFRAVSIGVPGGGASDPGTLLAGAWELGPSAVVFVVNLGAETCAGRVRLRPLPIGGRPVRLESLLDGRSEPRAGDELLETGLEVRLDPFDVRVLRIRPVEA